MLFRSQVDERVSLIELFALKHSPDERLGSRTIARRIFSAGTINLPCGGNATHFLQRLCSQRDELQQMEHSGAIHETVLDVIAPKLIHAGISEAQLAIELYSEMVQRGSHGTARFNQSLGEEVVGLASFGKSGLVRTGFDGPGGTGGTCIAVQSIGNAFASCSMADWFILMFPAVLTVTIQIRLSFIISAVCKRTSNVQDYWQRRSVAWSWSKR